MPTCRIPHAPVPVPTPFHLFQLLLSTSLDACINHPAPDSDTVDIINTLENIFSLAPVTTYLENELFHPDSDTIEIVLLFPKIPLPLRPVRSPDEPYS